MFTVERPTRCWYGDFCSSKPPPPPPPCYFFFKIFFFWKMHQRQRERERERETRDKQRREKEINKRAQEEWTLRPFRHLSNTWNWWCGLLITCTFVAAGWPLCLWCWLAIKLNVTASPIFGILSPTTDLEKKNNKHKNKKIKLKKKNRLPSSLSPLSLLSLCVCVSWKEILNFPVLKHECVSRTKNSSCFFQLSAPVMIFFVTQFFFFFILLIKIFPFSKEICDDNWIFSQKIWLY